jgi:hypothetical protein
MSIIKERGFYRRGGAPKYVLREGGKSDIIILEEDPLSHMAKH